MITRNCVHRSSANCPASAGKGSVAGWKFLAPPYYSQRAVFVSLWTRFSLVPFPSVLWRCWLGDRTGMRPVKMLVLVCWWWWFDWSFARLIDPVNLSPPPLSSSAPIKSTIRHSGNGLPRLSRKMALKRVWLFGWFTCDTARHDTPVMVCYALNVWLLSDPREAVSADPPRPRLQGDECAGSCSDAVHSVGSRLGLARPSQHRSSTLGRQQEQEAVRWCLPFCCL